MDRKHLPTQTSNGGTHMSYTPFPSASSVTNKKGVLNEYDCGCLIHRGSGGEHCLFACNLHNVAPLLLEALKETTIELKAYHHRDWQESHGSIPAHIAGMLFESCLGCAAIRKADQAIKEATQ